MPCEAEVNFIKLLKAEPVATMAVVTAFIGVLALVGVPKEVTGPIGILIGAILAFPVRGTVNTVAKTVEATTAAATNAAVKVAENLTSTTAGVAGQVTALGEAVVTDAIADTATQVLNGLGFSRKDRAA